jgi:hypothetical protein
MNKAIAMLAMLFLTLVAPVFPVRAQDKPNSGPSAKPEPVASTTIRLQFVLTEFEGDKKVKSLPYTILYNATHNVNLQSDFTRMRIGARVPVYTGKTEYRYEDVGTNLDCRAVRHEDGKFLVDGFVEHSWVEAVKEMSASGSRQDATPDPSNNPVIRNIRTGLTFLMRDGQTVESTTATDPVSGRLFHIEVALNVVK